MQESQTSRAKKRVGPSVKWNGNNSKIAEHFELKKLTMSATSNELKIRNFDLKRVPRYW